VELAQGVADCTALPQHVRGLAAWVVRGCRGEEAVPMEVDPPPGDSKEETTRKAKAKEAAAARRAKILAQMNKAQKTFAADNSVALAGMEDGARQEVARQDSLVAASVCLGQGQTKRGTSAGTYTCILCQEEGSVGGAGPALVMAAYIQKTTVLSQAAGLDRPQPVVAPHHLFVDRECGPHLSTCGHAMHAPCYQKFFDSLVQKERHNAINLLGKIQNFDVSVGEFTCPICERLSNTVLPLIPSVSQLRAKQSSAPSPEVGLKVFIEGLTSTAESWHLR
jgi:E3 ubiquitin-protein ligase UBR2